VRQRLRLIAALSATTLILGTLGYFWQHSRMPSTYSVMDMGYLDYGGGERPAAGHQHQGRPITELRVDPARPADVVVTLTARKQSLDVAEGTATASYTLNGTSPGPTIRASVGQLVEVRLHNENVPDGITLHWHGMEVPNSADGVAGVTQDAVLPGADFTYRFWANQAGTFWYHSHQVSHRQVIRGLFGAVVVTSAAQRRDVEAVEVVHHYQGVKTLNGSAADARVDVRPGTLVRIRLVNTDNGPISVWSASPARVVAVDGRDVNGPTDIVDRHVQITAGGRADLEVTAPADGSLARLDLGGTPAVLVGPSGGRAPQPTAQPQTKLDLLSYGAPKALPFDPKAPARMFDYSIGRRPGFVNGKPGLWWSINGHLWPDIPMFVVREGDVIRMKISNHSGDVHPMHLHGHHAVVLSRNGVSATGSPWWVDSLNVESGETYEIAFVADNPGIWMDHCHNLTHASEGLVAHLMYEGVTEPFFVGGAPKNRPE